MARRKGRGRLSSIDLLPADAEPIITWAYGELRDRTRDQKDILKEFNKKLAKIGEGPISRSAFSRKSMRLSDLARRLEETREITAALTDRLGAGATDDMTIMVAETLKTLVFELLADSGDAGMSTKAVMELSTALKNTVAAQSVSSKRKREVEEDFKAKASTAIDKVAKAKGLTTEAVAQLRRDILGVKTA